MVQTWNSSSDGGGNPPDPVVAQLAAIAAKLESMDPLKAGIEGSDTTHDPIATQLTTKISPISSSPNQMGTLAAQLATIAARLDSLVAMKEDIKAIKTWWDIREYREDHHGPLSVPVKEDLSGRVLGVQSKIEDLDHRNRSKEDWPGKRTDVDSEFQITNSTGSDSVRTALEFGLERRQGECFRCGDEYRPGQLCKTGMFKLPAIAHANEEPAQIEGDETVTTHDDLTVFNLHVTLGKLQFTSMKLQELKLNTQLVTPFGMQIGNGDSTRCNRYCRDISICGLWGPTGSSCCFVRPYGQLELWSYRFYNSSGFLEASPLVLEWPIFWGHRPLEEATWEHHALLGNHFSSFRLEDKSSFRVGSIDTNPLLPAQIN